MAGSKKKSVTDHVYKVTGLQIGDGQGVLSPTGVLG